MLEYFVGLKLDGSGVKYRPLQERPSCWKQSKMQTSSWNTSLPCKEAYTLKVNTAGGRGRWLVQIWMFSCWGTGRGWGRAARAYKSPYIANLGVFNERLAGWVGGCEPRQGYGKCSSELDGRGQLRTSSWDSLLRLATSLRLHCGRNSEDPPRSACSAAAAIRRWHAELNIQTMLKGHIWSTDSRAITNKHITLLVVSVEKIT